MANEITQKKFQKLKCQWTCLGSNLGQLLHARLVGLVCIEQNSLFVKSQSRSGAVRSAERQLLVLTVRGQRKGGSLQQQASREAVVVEALSSHIPHKPFTA